MISLVDFSGILSSGTNDTTEDTTRRDDFSVFTNAERITRKLSTREPFDNREGERGEGGRRDGESDWSKDFRNEEREETGRVWFSAVLCNNVPFRTWCPLPV